MHTQHGCTSYVMHTTTCMYPCLHVPHGCVVILMWCAASDLSPDDEARLCLQDKTYHHSCNGQDYWALSSPNIAWNTTVILQYTTPALLNCCCSLHTWHLTTSGNTIVYYWMCNSLILQLLESSHVLCWPRPTGSHRHSIARPSLPLLGSREFGFCINDIQVFLSFFTLFTDIIISC